jgi:hypothetical protein
MAKNRKNKSVAIRFGPALKALLICAFFVASGVGYVWQKSLIAELERQLKTRELALAEGRYKNEKLRERVAGLTSPVELKKRLTELNLVEPQPTQVWRLVEPAGPPAGRQFAARP